MNRRQFTSFTSAIGLSALLPKFAIAQEKMNAINPPQAKKIPTTIKQLGRVRHDDYAWMRDKNWQDVLNDPSKLDPEIRAHLDAENAYTDAILLNPKKDMREVLFNEMKGRIKEDDSTPPMPNGGFAYYRKFREGGQYPIIARFPINPKTEEKSGDEIILLDGDEAAKGKKFCLNGPNAQNLRNISTGKFPFSSIDKTTKANALSALNKADSCLLRLQIRQNGVLTGWAGQYDKDSLQPSMGRKFELPSIVSQESVEILHYLMNIEKPSKAQVLAIESGIAWLKKSAIKGQRLETFKLENKQEFQYHNIDFDRRIVKDENAPLLWARFYDLNDNSIILANRDSIRVDAYDKINIERRTGYNWYGYWPQKLIDIDYPKWKMRIKSPN